jgi:hypothetical protein
VAKEYSRGSLSEDDAKNLLQTLISWLIRSVESREGALVTRKLCSTLVVYFLQFSASWARCVKHLMYCICIGQVAPYDTLEKSPETHQLIQNITAEKATVILWFASNLVEEVGKTDSTSMKQLSLVHALVVDPN